MNQFTKLIAAQLNLKEQAVENTLALLEEGCTIPFISRYRKEKTGNMDEVNIEAIAQANEKLSEMAKRKETILKTIEEQGKLSDELKKRIEQCWDATELDCGCPFAWSEGWLMYFDSYATGKRIQHLRKAKGMTQEELAIKLNISDRHL